MAYIIIGTAVGFILGCFLMYIRTVRNRKKIMYPKILVSAVVLHGMLLTTTSYVLAWNDKEPVASVSEIIVKEIVAPVVVYLVTNVIANIFEKNVTAISTPIKEDEANG